MTKRSTTLSGVALLVAAAFILPTTNAALMAGADHNQTCMDDTDQDASFDDLLGNSGDPSAGVSDIDAGERYHLCLWAILDWWTPVNLIDFENVWFSDPWAMTSGLVIETAQILGEGMAGERPQTGTDDDGQVRAYQDGNDAGTVDGIGEALCFDTPLEVDPCDAVATLEACHIVPGNDGPDMIPGTPDDVPPSVDGGDFCLMGAVGAYVGGWASDLPPECLFYEGPGVEPWFVGHFLHTLYPSATTSVNQVVKVVNYVDPDADPSTGDCDTDECPETLSGFAGRVNTSVVGGYEAFDIDAFGAVLNGDDVCIKDRVDYSEDSLV